MRVQSFVVLVLALAGSAVAQPDTPRQVRYDFALEVSRNAVIGSSVEPQNPLLAGLVVGTTGRFSVEARETEAFVFPAFNQRFWTVIDVSLEIGEIDLGADPTAYPSQGDDTALWITDNVGPLGDLFQVLPAFDQAPFEDPFLTIQDPDPGFTGTADLFDGVSLPTDIDLNNAGGAAIFEFNAPQLSQAVVTAAITDVAITVIPAPAGASAIA
ncbi:MAG: hypothetical protein AAF937_04395 [Planctomycetota bacterium]